MDTKPEYQDLEFYVVMAGDLPPQFIQDAWREIQQAKVDDPDSHMDEVGELTPCDDHHYLNEDVPIDGRVHFYYPDRLDPDSPGHRYAEFPFRSVHKDKYPWFSRPDADKWGRHPVWKWQNPDKDPHEHLDLTPSLGRRDGDGNIIFHCWIENGSIRWT